GTGFDFFDLSYEHAMRDSTLSRGRQPVLIFSGTTFQKTKVASYNINYVARALWVLCPKLGDIFVNMG
ncbi:MAG: hypothetical protein WAW37_06785, partial [Syntrophobacteraceae bacterium]